MIKNLFASLSYFFLFLSITCRGQDVDKGLCSPLVFSHPQGFYTSPFKLTISNIPQGATIRYTLNGMIPDSSSNVYNDSLIIQDLSDKPNSISLIPTNPLDSPYGWYLWKPPQNNINKATVLRLKVFTGVSGSDYTYTLTYWVDPIISERYHNFPVVSIVTDSLSFYDYNTGIYIPGLQYDLYGTWEWWGGDNANYSLRGDEWERKANLAFFEGNGDLAFQQNVGIRIHGGGTRVFPQKSLRIYARSEYGTSKMNYRFFPDKNVHSFKRVLFANNGQDFIEGGMNDVISSILIKNMNVDIQAFRPAILFVNGEYWGIHSIRDRLDNYYLAYTHGADPDNVDIIEGDGLPEEGDSTNYREMIHYLENNSLTDNENYSYVSSWIDIPAYIDYVIAKQYLGIVDWPANNSKCWREKINGAKWRWFTYDNNGAISFLYDNTIGNSIAEENMQLPNQDWSTLILRSLLKNQGFKHEYLERFDYHIQNTFNPDRVINCIDSISNLMLPVYDEHILRWSYPANMGIRDEMIAKMKDFAVGRPEIIRSQLRQFITSGVSAQPEETIKVFSTENRIHILDLTHERSFYKIFDVVGRCHASGELKSGADVSIPAPFANGLMLIQITKGNKSELHKVLVVN